MVRSDIDSVFKSVKMLSFSGHSAIDPRTNSMSTPGMSNVTMPAIIEENSAALLAMGIFMIGKYDAS